MNTSKLSLTSIVSELKIVSSKLEAMIFYNSCIKQWRRVSGQDLLLLTDQVSTTPFSHGDSLFEAQFLLCVSVRLTYLKVLSGSERLRYVGYHGDSKEQQTGV